MRQLQPVLWTKGVLLSPQHLQTQDRFLEEVLEFRLSSLRFCPWGYRTLELDREALDAGSVAISAASGIFPDGLLFDIPASDPPPPPRPLEGLWPEDRDTVDLFLAVPELRLGGFNISTPGTDGSTRFMAEVVLRRDENTGLAEKPIQVARKNFRILVEGESLDGSSTLPLARVYRSESGEVQLEPRFVPPLLDIAASDYLMSIARRFVEILTAKSSELSGLRRHRNRSLADFGVSDVANFWLLYTVNTHLPQLRHIFETRRGHPGELFEALLGLGGALTTFSGSLHPRDLPEYSHVDLSGCFTRIDEQLRELLETVVPSNHASITLRKTEPSIHAGALDQDRFLSGRGFYLAMNAEMKPADLARRAPQQLKVAAGDRMDRLIKQALPGVTITHVEQPPRSLPVKLDYQYFALEPSGPEWEAILRSRNVAVYVPSDFRTPELELVILLPEGEAGRG